jgi:GNAT superfamily N-acetyltransferase
MRVATVAEARTRELRRAVLRPDVAPGAALPGDDLPGAVHLGACRADGTVASTCFVYPDRPPPGVPDRPAWHLRQMATAPGCRGRGYAGLVIEAAASLVRQRGGTVLWCYARERAVPLYLRHGFVEVGDVFTDERHRIPHQLMWRELTDASTSP